MLLVRADGAVRPMLLGPGCTALARMPLGCRPPGVHVAGVHAAGAHVAGAHAPGAHVSGVHAPGAHAAGAGCMLVGQGVDKASGVVHWPVLCAWLVVPSRTTTADCWGWWFQMRHRGVVRTPTAPARGGVLRRERRSLVWGALGTGHGP